VANLYLKLQILAIFVPVSPHFKGAIIEKVAMRRTSSET